LAARLTPATQVLISAAGCGTLRALADVDVGQLIDDAAMQAWANSLGTDHVLPATQPTDAGSLEC
jgi:hypothetical protein